MSILPKLSIRELQSHTDGRGMLTEVFRNDWLDNNLPIQWNYVRSEANVLRGVHVHIKHVDYIVVLRGTMLLGTCDLREGSANFMESELNELSGKNLALATIPVGVAHGFYFPEATDFIYSVSSYWDPVNDEFGCTWNDEALGLNWPVKKPVLSERDQLAQPLSALLNELRTRSDKPW